MADVVVVGAGLGGLATAARLAKLGHRVVVFERGSEPGGLLRTVRAGGHEWDATPLQTTVPAVLRDLFRKSGRPLERYVDLELSTPARRHIFRDGSVLDLPTGSRGGQLDAVRDGLDERAGAAWTGFVDNQGDVWELIRTKVLDVPDGVRRLGERRLARGLHARTSLDRLLRKTFDDERLRLLARFPTERSGADPAAEPSFRAVEPYLERTLGVWRSPAGMRGLTKALLTRMSERSVDVRFDTEVVALHISGGRVVGVGLADGSTADADIVVTAVAPQEVFGRLLDDPGTRGAAALFDSSGKSSGRTVSYVGLAGAGPDLPGEVVLHGDPLVVVSTGGVAPPGQHAWTVSVPRAVADPLDTLAERGMDIRSSVTARVDAADLNGSRRMTGEASLPLRWRGARTAAARGAWARPLPGLHCLGTGLVLGASVPYVAWQAAHVAELVGKA